MLPTLVIPAYNRPQSLQRLLHSLQQADYPGPTRLVIVIDGGGEHETAVTHVAHQFQWRHGRKDIIHQRQNIGLIGNVFFCGDLSARYDSIILLEDDLAVSPMFYRYAQQALSAHADDERVAGISLNALWFNGFTHQRFEPLLDDGDTFCAQIAWYQGQAYTAAQWQHFRTWCTTADWTVHPADGLHPLFSRFPRTDWFPVKTKFLVQTGRFYVFPRESLTTNFGDAGTHFTHATRFFQVPLQTRRRDFRFLPLAESDAVYDTFHELLPDRLLRLAPHLEGAPFDVDLNATKAPDQLRHDHVLTTRPSRAPLQRFGQLMRPPEANVIAQVPGSDIVLSRVADVDYGRVATWRTHARNAVYANHGRRSTLRNWLAQKVFR